MKTFAVDEKSVSGYIVRVMVRIYSQIPTDHVTLVP